MKYFSKLHTLASNNKSNFHSKATFPEKHCRNPRNVHHTKFLAKCRSCKLFPLIPPESFNSPTRKQSGMRNAHPSTASCIGTKHDNNEATRHLILQDIRPCILRSSAFLPTKHLQWREKYVCRKKATFLLSYILFSLSRSLSATPFVFRVGTTLKDRGEAQMWRKSEDSRRYI